ncbi:N-acetyl-gamma-glutamyl-phosphate reductase [Azohydromonas sediminis]|uniref:N-acetyl-gamma-glutamyl-phosphate reductase n=1 Tax=Azohydromonas sediminis TaxID=2259674 RepID=UPI000E646BC4|nr:N-acetyl-gamma-glutamyl-phosphate reductase [Azohydromonas sediminis]
MASKHVVYVDGQEGTTGLRIHEVLAQRDDVELLKIDPERRKDPAERARLLNAADVAFLCLPDAAAREAVGLVTNPRTCLIDASTAHRTASGWVYGFPELAPGQRERLRAGKRIANPGCHATAFVALLRPLVDAGLVPHALPVAATSLTGFSGGGKKMIEQYAAGGDARLQAPRPYALSLAHKHIPEMVAHTGLHARPMFLPVVGPFYKGLAVSVPLHYTQLPGGVDAAALHAALQHRYAGERFVRVMPLSDPATLADGFFDVQGCNDTNRLDIFVFGAADQALLVARLDNLGKGASGAAVQCMNVHLGVDEGLGLA